MPISEAKARYRAIIGGRRRAIANGERSADDPELVDAYRDLAALKLTDYIEKVLAEAPPLTDAQRAALTELLRPGGA